MAKGYWVARVELDDPEAYKEYTSANGVAFAKYGGRFLVRGGPFETRQGTGRSRNVVIEFPSYQAALDCWDSPEYQAAKAKQRGVRQMDLIIVEGYEGPQPA